MYAGFFRSPFRIPLLVLIFLAGTAPPRALAYPGPPGKDERTTPVIRAVRVAAAGPEIDGRLDDPIWRTAIFASGFTQRDPDEGEAATEKTEIAFCFDDNALYIGARMFVKNPGTIRAQVTRRDYGGNSERLIISLDTYLDHRTAYSFGVTAAGIRLDYYHASDHERRRDYSFDPVWQAKAQIDQQGWTAEFRIPFSQLRFNAQDEQIWGININRWSPTTRENAYWVYIPKNETGWASRFGSLTGIRGIKPSRRIELLPYVAGDATLHHTADPANPFSSRSSRVFRTGADLKMGVGPNLTLDATINPDFGQVEADPAEVNLSAFETFFPERRPFFTEGAQLLRGSGPGYFYSRRIGARPHGSAAGDYTDKPDNSTIIGASKITGRLSSGLSIGMLGAVTANEYARSFEAATGTFASTRIEPATGYGVLRLQQEFGATQSTAGFILTGVHRNLGAHEPLAAILNRDAITGGGDWNLRFHEGKYNLSGHLGFSYVRGDTAALQALQKSSTHYFQRPDAEHVTYNPARTSLAGYTAGLGFSKNGGEHWLWGLHLNAESPAFELNDLGRLNSADDASAFAFLNYRENKPGKLLRSYRISMSGAAGWNFGGDRQFSHVGLETRMTFLNYWNIEFDLRANPRALSSHLTRGGPLMATPAGWGASARLSNNRASKTRWRLRGRYGRDELGGWRYNLNTSITINPAPSWELALRPSYARGVNPRQYSYALEGGRAETFGVRYIFSFTDRRTISTRLRMNYAISPDLSIELYAEPFAASGRFYNWSELPAPRSLALRRYGTDGTFITQDVNGDYTVTDGVDTLAFAGRDFNVLSFRSNLVLRWEWLPGSTLYLVWQQNRSAPGAADQPIRPASLFEAATETAGDNFIAMKIAYWLPVN